MATETGSPDHPRQNYGARGENQPQQAAQATARMNLTREELRVLKECNRESFWYRCVPFGVSFMALTQLAVKQGILKGHPTRGAMGKNLAALAAGYILGKWSYQSVCREKILALENSPLADSLRKQQGKGIAEVLPEVAFGDSNPFSSASSGGQHHTDDYQNNEVNTDQNKVYSGLDESKRPTLDSNSVMPSLQSPGQDGQQSYTTYQELRQKNREDYEKKMSSVQSRQPPQLRPRPPDYSQQPPPPSRPFSSRESTPKHTRKNQYGDVWEE